MLRCLLRVQKANGMHCEFMLSQIRGNWKVYLLSLIHVCLFLYELFSGCVNSHSVVFKLRAIFFAAFRVFLYFTHA